MDLCWIKHIIHDKVILYPFFLHLSRFENVVVLISHNSKINLHWGLRVKYIRNLWQRTITKPCYSTALQSFLFQQLRFTVAAQIFIPLGRACTLNLFDLSGSSKHRVRQGISFLLAALEQKLPQVRAHYMLP